MGVIIFCEYVFRVSFAYRDIFLGTNANFKGAAKSLHSLEIALKLVR